MLAAQGPRCNDSFVIKIKDHRVQTRHSSGVGASLVTLGIIEEKYLQSPPPPRAVEYEYHNVKMVDGNDNWIESENIRTA